MSDTITATPITVYTVQAAVLAKVAKRDAALAYTAAEADAIAAMVADGIISVELADDTLVTIVRPEREAIDVEALAEVIPASVLDRITKVVRVVDKEALAEAIKIGLIAPSAVEAATKKGEAKPSLRITARAKKPAKA